MSSLYLGYCLENEFYKKHDFFLNLVCVIDFRWRHISSIECGGSGSNFGGVCIHSRLYSTKTTWFRCVFYWLLVILPQMRGVWGAFPSVRAYSLALRGHVSQWMRGTWGAVWVFAHAPRNPFKWLCRTWGAVWGFANAQSVHGSCDQMTSKTCKLDHLDNLNNRSYCLWCSVIGYIVYLNLLLLSL